MILMCTIGLSMACISWRKRHFEPFLPEKFPVDGLTQEVEWFGVTYMPQCHVRKEDDSVPKFGVQEGTLRDALYKLSATPISPLLVYISTTDDNGLCMDFTLFPVLPPIGKQVKLLRILV